MKYIGNEDFLEQIRIAQIAAREMNSAMPHMLFAGAAGCGKTTLSRKVAEESGYKHISATPESLGTRRGIVDTIDMFDETGYDKYGNRIDRIKPTLLFIDEIHGLSIKAQELLGVAMEDLEIESDIKGLMKWIPRFTLVGATTDDGILSKPFRDRFKFRFPFSPYKLDEIYQIIEVHAERLKVTITPKAIREIARRGRGTPRIVVGYLERCRDMGIAHRSEVITSAITAETFKQLHIDKDGLLEVEVEILRALYEARVAVGLDALAIRVNENKKTLTCSAEPYLIQQGLMTVGGRGRKITEKGVKHLEQNGYAGRKKITKVDLPRGYKRT
jgi:Holliday junction DNA helicase RuvB